MANKKQQEPEKPQNPNLDEYGRPKKLDFENTNFFDLLAQSINDPVIKRDLVESIIFGIKKNDPTAARIMQVALERAVAKDENKPIPILGGITQKDALQSDNSTPQNPQTK